MRDQKEKNQQGEAALEFLMDEQAELEGQRLWEEYEQAVLSGKAQPVTPALDSKCRENMEQAFRARTEKPGKRRLLGAVSRVAACAVILLVLTTATILGADADSDIHVDRFLQHACSLSEMQNRYVIHLRRYPASEVQDVESVSKAMANLQSKGYWRYWEYTNYRATEERPAMGLYSEYHNEQGQKVWLECRMPISGIIIVYKDGDTYASSVDCLGYNMVLVERTGSRQIFWLDDAEGLCYCLYAEGLSESDFWDLVYTVAQA